MSQAKKVVLSEKSWFLLEKFAYDYSEKREVDELLLKIQELSRGYSPSSTLLAMIFFLSISAEVVDEIVGDTTVPENPNNDNI